MSERLLINVFNVDAALALARLQGMFAARGLDVDITVTPNSTEQMQRLGRGSWQVVSTAFDNVLGWSGREGVEIVAVLQVAHGIVLPVYVRPEIGSWEDLRGRPLAVDAVDTAYALVLRRILSAHGLELERGDYALIPKGTTGHRLESMLQRETFAGVLNPPWDRKAEAAGLKRFADQREVLPNYPGGVYAVARPWAYANRRLLVNFLAAWDTALRWCRIASNREQAIRSLEDAEKIDRSTAASRVAALPASGRLDLPGLQSVLDLRVQFRLMPPLGKDLARYYDESFYAETSK